MNIASFSTQASPARIAYGSSLDFITKCSNRLNYILEYTVPALLFIFLCCNCLFIIVLYATIRLTVATHKVSIQFERRPYSIQSYLINSRLIKWIKAVITVG